MKFYDWLTVSQEHDHDLPLVCDTFFMSVDAITGDVLSTTQRKVKHQASFSTSVFIHVIGRTVRVHGNPSRVGRLDNLFGFSTIDQCITVFNQLLAERGLPPFTRCTRTYIRDGKSGGFSGDLVADGAVIHRIDMTTNISVGFGNEPLYIKSLSSQRIGHSIGFLYPNGKTCTWTPEGNGKGGRLEYRKAYCKATELSKKLLPRILRDFGPTSAEYEYVCKVRDYCVENGVVRMEQELKAEYLKRKGLAFWGLFDENLLQAKHNEFLSVDQKLQVSAMDITTIADELLNRGYVRSRQSANSTASVAFLWMQGQPLGIKQRQFDEHASRLNKIGINIRNECDHSKFSPVIIKQVREINKTVLHIPDGNWYRKPNHLQVAA
ncbi:phage/plasmid replication protein [Pseudomonas savastanoi]|uniref:phage/plasmid replication domain-containing protein n=1 Tax=Pseudomonas savastanoi TaxID=29438 RepID=UPI00210AAB5D|nr:phage/plasmid replication protein [Pseudomonas savastanoi]MCQ3006409.1 phage/plasmid replication protein [Pseudomonas savastanoi]